MAWGPGKKIWEGKGQNSTYLKFEWRIWVPISTSRLSILHSHHTPIHTYMHIRHRHRHTHTHSHTPDIVTYTCTHSEECTASRRAWAWNWGEFTCAWHQRGMEVAGGARNKKRRDNEKRQILGSVLIPLAWWERCGVDVDIDVQALFHGQDGTTTQRVWNTGLKSSGMKEGFQKFSIAASGYFEIKMKNMAACERTWKNLKFHDRTWKSPLHNKDRKNEGIFKYCSAHGKTLGFETNKLVSNYKIRLLHRHCFLCLEWTIEAIADKSIFLSHKKWWQISL